MTSLAQNLGWKKILLGMRVQNGLSHGYKMWGMKRGRRLHCKQEKPSSTSTTELPQPVLDREIQPSS
jgi:hypothetical protein